MSDQRSGDNHVQAEVLRAEVLRAVQILLNGEDSGRAGAEPDPDDPVVDSLVAALHRVDLPGGQVLFEQGDVGDAMFVISRGRLRFRSTDASGEDRSRELGPGQSVGELALLTGEPRQGTVLAVRDSVLYRLGREDFERCALTHPRISHNMLVVLAHRLNRPATRGRPDVVPANIVILPAGRNSPTREFAEAFHSFMARHRRATLVTRLTLEEAVGAGAVDADPASPLGVALREHLVKLEECFDHVLFVADDDEWEWGIRVARGADAILLVGRAGASPARNGGEALLFDRLVRDGAAAVHLVLVESESQVTPTGTARWLDDRPVRMSHHLKLGDQTHLARLARFLVGAPVGLVLSGGAVRAFAHLGVVRALSDAGIPIDVVAGTSAGALVGAQLAMGHRPETIAQAATELFGGPRRKMMDFIPPFASLIGATRFNSALDELFGDVLFEDLWMQFLCTTTDLTSATSRSHQRGRLRHFVRASCSLPMIMPPVTHEGHLLADGGIINNVPVEPLLEFTAIGTLIAVNVTNPFYTADEAYNYVDSLPLRRVLASRLNPRAEPLIAPGIFDVLMRSLEIGSKSMEAAQIAKADLYLRPAVSQFGYTDVGSIDLIVAEGHREALRRLRETNVPAIPFTES